MHSGGLSALRPFAARQGGRFDRWVARRGHFRRDALNAPLCANDGGDVAAINLDPAPVRASRKRIERIVFGRGRSRVSACQKSFDKPADGRASSLTAAAPTSFFAEIFQISGRKNCKGTIFALENGIFRRFQSSRLTRTCRRVWLKIREDFDPLKFSEGFFDSLSRGRSRACEGQAAQVFRLRAGAGMLPPRGQKRRARRRGKSGGFRTKLWELTPSARHEERARCAAQLPISPISSKECAAPAFQSAPDYCKI